jgi:hypothetical protein
MHEKEKAAHWECAAGYSYELGPSDIDEEQTEHKPDSAKIAKKIADYVRILKPWLLISADEAIFQYELLAGLQGKYHRATPKPTIESLCDDVLRTRATTIVLCDSALDAELITRKTRCYVLTLKSGGAE